MPASGPQPDTLPQLDDDIDMGSPELQLQCAPKRQCRPSPEAAAEDAGGLLSVAGSMAATQRQQGQQEASEQLGQQQRGGTEEGSHGMSMHDDDSAAEGCVEEQGQVEIESEWRANDVVCGACDDGGALCWPLHVDKAPIGI